MIYMTRPVPAPLVDDERLTLDREYLTVYGGYVESWVSDTRSEYRALSDAASKRRMYRDHLPQHPRRASAGSRRHHRKYLPWRIGLLAPGAATILLTPTWTDTGDTDGISFMALVRDSRGLPMKLPAGGSQRLAALLQGAFGADWSKCQTWRADTNLLHEYSPPTADYLDTVAAGYVESLDQYDARLAAKAGA